MSQPAPKNILTLPRPARPAVARPAAAPSGLARPQASKPGLSGTLAHGLSVLAAFDAQSPWLSNAELSVRTGLSRATVARLTRTLTQAGFLRHHEASSRYAVWTGALRASHALLASNPLRQWTRPGMRALAIDLRACVSLHLLDKDQALILDTAQGGDVEAALPEIGMAMDALESPVGWALLALLSDAERESMMLRVAERARERWLSFGAAARAGVQSCRRDGYCTDLGPTGAHLRTVGVPLARTADGVCFALGCSIEVFRLRPGQLQDEIGPRLLALARSIRATISGASPA
jgi:DNA-binding IclR family transcriptional regulator